jgi:hypothetical protein
VSSFGEVLDKFKKNEEAENLMPLVEDAALRNGLVAWKSVVIRYKEATDCTFKDETSQWNWLWSQVEYDAAYFGVVAGVKTQEAQSLLNRLMGLRLIYPDGSINHYAKQYLQSIIMAKLGGKKK